VLRLVPISFDANTITFFFGLLRNHKEYLEGSVLTGATGPVKIISRARLGLSAVLGIRRGDELPLPHA
jgi:hypothetical protein